MPVPSTPSAGPPASPRLGLRAGVLWTFGGQVVFSAAQFVMVAVLARLGTKVDVGTYGLGLALTAPVFLLLGLQLRSVQATDAQNQTPFGQYFSLRVLSMLLALLATVLLVALYPQAGWAIWWLGLAKAFEGVSDVTYGLMQRNERLDLVSRSVLWRGLLGLGLMAGLFVLNRSLAWATFGVALAGLLTLLAYDLPRARRLAPPEPGGNWWTRFPAALPRLALPLGVVAGLVSLGSALPRLFVEKALGAAPLGVYLALAYVTVAGSVLIVALGTALTTRLSQAFAAGDRATFLRLTGRLTAAAAAVGLGLVLLALLAGEPLLRLLYGEAYAGQNAVFVWLNLSGALGYVASCAGFAVTAARRFGQQLPLFAAVTLVLALACWQLIPAHGLIGAAWAALIAAGVQLAGSWGIVIQALRDLPPASPSLSGDS
ncbi:lipopolysaccharide biosynthesis protein [Deinococcus frigens]|uniref:lipopolysaccharide biosynthesis protein n=1 Tax=Deinococcus frigens TaxID=249403 RepID=UPI000AF514A9|nr:lipopolysaccharide biosynthesis protein [Deinococcus frigens]